MATYSYRLGGPHVGKLGTQPLPLWGSRKLRWNHRGLHNTRRKIGHTTRAILGAHRWANWLYNRVPVVKSEPKVAT